MRFKAELSRAIHRAFQEREAERESIARELHDKFGQFLTVMEMELENVAASAGLPPDLRARIEKLRTLTANAHNDVGQLAWEIRPASLHGQRLQDASEQLLEEWGARSPLAFDVHLSLGDRRLPEATETTIYRVLQEAVTNVVKHARATRVGVILQATAKEIRLIVEDDGEGFSDALDTKAGCARGRFGLLGIRERLALVNGTLEIESVPGKGTTLLISVPI